MTSNRRGASYRFSSRWHPHLMIFTIALPDILAEMTSAEIDAVYCKAGEELERGGKIVSVKVDLSSVFQNDCPPISYYRLSVSSRLWVREVRVNVGDSVPVGGILALCSTTPDEDVSAGAAEPARLWVIPILGHSGI